MTKKLSRRQMLIAGASVPALMATGMAGETDSIAPRVDTHLHCFAGASNPRFPYHVRSPYRPDSPATPQQLLACMDGAGVDFAVVVHPEPYQDDHRYLEHCLDVGGERLKGTCLFFADRPGSVAKLPDLVKRAPIVAARVHAYAPDRLPPFGKPELRDLWKMASDLGLAMQLHFEPRYASGFEPLIKEFAKTPVIIDHLGRPFQGTPQEHEVVVRWSRFENAVIKLSSIPLQTKYPHRDVAPIIRRLVDEFGSERMIYGGGFNADATAKSYRSAFDRAESFVAYLPEAERAAILGGNAAKLFGFA